MPARIAYARRSGDGSRVVLLVLEESSVEPAMLSAPDFHAKVGAHLFAVSNDTLRDLQRDLERHFGGPPPARTWSRCTQTDTKDSLLMSHIQERIVLHREAPPAEIGEYVRLGHREATQVRDFLDYWLSHWGQDEEFPPQDGD